MKLLLIILVLLAPLNALTPEQAKLVESAAQTAENLGDKPSADMIRDLAKQGKVSFGSTPGNCNAACDMSTGQVTINSSCAAALTRSPSVVQLVDLTSSLVHEGTHAGQSWWTWGCSEQGYNNFKWLGFGHRAEAEAWGATLGSMAKWISNTKSQLDATTDPAMRARLATQLKAVCDTFTPTYNDWNSHDYGTLTWYDASGTKLSPADVQQHIRDLTAEANQVLSEDGPEIEKGTSGADDEDRPGFYNPASVPSSGPGPTSCPGDCPPRLFSPRPSWMPWVLAPQPIELRPDDRLPGRDELEFSARWTGQLELTFHNHARRALTIEVLPGLPFVAAGGGLALCPDRQELTLAPGQRQSVQIEALSLGELAQGESLQLSTNPAHYPTSRVVIAAWHLTGQGKLTCPRPLVTRWALACEPGGVLSLLTSKRAQAEKEARGLGAEPRALWTDVEAVLAQAQAIR